MNDKLNQLLQTDKSFAKMSEEKGAPAAFAQFLAEDAILLPNNNLPQLGRNKIVEFMKAPGPNYDLLWKPETGTVSQSGDMGYTWGNYKMVIKNNEGEVVETERGKYLNVWVKRNGTWKLLVDMGNMSPSKK